MTFIIAKTRSAYLALLTDAADPWPAKKGLGEIKKSFEEKRPFGPNAIAGARARAAEIAAPPLIIGFNLAFNA